MQSNPILPALKHLSGIDPILAGIIAEVEPFTLTPVKNHFACLVESILSQVISVQAAETITRRLKAEVEGHLSPKAVLQLSPEQGKVIGLGKQKYNYLRHLSDAFLSDPDRYQGLQQLSDAAAIKALTDIKGIGIWTAQMYLIFGLARLDVFAPLDLALQQAMEQLYHWPSSPRKKDLVKKAEDWAPHRSVASILLWKKRRIMTGRPGGKDGWPI